MGKYFLFLSPQIMQNEIIDIESQKHTQMFNYEIN